MVTSRRPIFALLVSAVCISARSVGQPDFLEVSQSSDPHHDDHGHHEKPVQEHHPAHSGEPIIDHAHEEENTHVDEHVSDHVHHGAEAQHTGVNGDCPGNQSANSVAVGLLASVVLMPLLVYMTMTKAAGGAVSALTFKFVDLSTSIFLAVLWFSASSEVLEMKALKTLFPYAEEAFAILQVFLLYCIAMMLAHVFRHNKYYLLTFCGCAGHYIAFAAIKAAGESQHKFQQGLQEGNKLYGSFGFCILVFVVLTSVSLICFYGWGRRVKDEELQFAVEELEYDIVGLVVSFAITQAVRHLLTGHYPSQAHMLLQVDCGSGPHHFQHSAEQRTLMLLWSVAITIIAIGTLSWLEDLKEHSGYWKHKALHITQVIMVMCAAWGYLLWGEWQFYETYFHGDKMFGKMVFAILATVFCLLFTTTLAFATHGRFSNAKGYANLTIMAISLVAAWSWEHCFHTALGVIADQYQVGYGGLIPKMLVALIIPLVILPGYVVFLKPIVVENEELEEGEEKAATASTRIGQALFHRGDTNAVEEPSAEADGSMTHAKTTA